MNLLTNKQIIHKKKLQNYTNKEEEEDQRLGLTDLSFIDGKVNAFENLLPGLSNHGRQVFDFEQELLLLVLSAGSFRRINGGERGGDHRQRPAMVGAGAEGRMRKLEEIRRRESNK